MTITSPRSKGDTATSESDYVEVLERLVKEESTLPPRTPSRTPTSNKLSIKPEGKDSDHSDEKYHPGKTTTQVDSDPYSYSSRG